jgi:hypothetical protein
VSRQPKRQVRREASDFEPYKAAKHSFGSILHREIEVFGFNHNNACCQLALWLRRQKFSVRIWVRGQQGNQNILLRIRQSIVNRMRYLKKSCNKALISVEI